MLSDMALEYYFTHVKCVAIEFYSTLRKLKERFLTEEMVRTMTQEWWQPC